MACCTISTFGELVSLGSQSYMVYRTGIKIPVNTNQPTNQPQ